MCSGLLAGSRTPVKGKELWLQNYTWGLVCHKMCNACMPASGMDLREELGGARDKRMHPLHPSSLSLCPH